MSEQLQRTLHSLLQQNSGLLKGIQHGIEKEGLRVDTTGRVSQREHPRGLGKALTHSRITTDYSEALLEFITPVFSDIDQALHYLEELHRFSFEQLDSELIWAASMPPSLNGPEDIPIAEYGSSNIGRLKHIYRVGLEHRYGRVMQSIAGIHYNFSLPAEFWPHYQAVKGDSGTSLQDLRSNAYFALIRNFRRFSWLLIYLFGASPALSRSFVEGDSQGLLSHGEQTLYGPHATSLRMSDLGYSNQAQSQLNICYNTLDNYAKTLAQAITTPYPPYQQIGVRVDGEYRQLNTNLLQIENEYYSDIRPKRVTHSGEKPLQALNARGVEYVEVRSLDINPFLPVGLDAEQARFLDCFLVYCLLLESGEIDDSECARIKENHARVVRRGRQPGLELQLVEGKRSLSEWGLSLLDALLPVAEELDRAEHRACHTKAVIAQREKLLDPEATPSGQVLQELQRENLSYDEFALKKSLQHRERLREQALSAVCRQELDRLTARSQADQAALEAAAQPPFDEFLRNYLQS
ncbi:glutamate--cysteine ligase [Motiliproteus sp. SC1-56]|uniref:glutamate--cysteine ligase n=1 Tax=Motiliproteus sp. SC1-56 TaxID=2799565 RepID=UPI001A8E349D|nr:glutamate--cysteine ligase [Motiliproteus sp. SC1-56]